MKKGLTITLLTVALAMIGFQAMAAAPVIGDIHSPIVGNGDATAANVFVYPDAIDLTSFVTDDTSPSASVIWSYEASSSKYTLNGISPINDTDPADIEVTPGAKKVAPTHTANGELDYDTNPATITVRNQDLSPLGSATTTPAETGVLTAQTASITLYASDGSTFSQKDLVIYTDNGGMDRMSPDEGTKTKVYDPDFGTGNGGFVFSPMNGTVTVSSAGGKLCMETTAMGDNMALWVGAANSLPLAKNSVYDVTLQMTSNNAAPGHTPFWDLSLDNNNNAGDGLNLYGADCFFLDNENGANAAVTAGKAFHMIWTPLAVATDQWNGAGAFASADTIFATAHAAKKDGRFMFRVMDIWQNGTSGIKANIQYGTICVNDLTVWKTDLASVKTVGTSLYNQNAFVLSTGSGVGKVAKGDLVAGAATVTIVSGAINIVPTTAGRGTAYETFYPGDTDNVYDPLRPTSQADNFPVVCDANTIYRIQVEIATVANADNPPDAFWIAADTPTNEVIYNSFVTSGLGGAAMPKTGTQTYTAFYHSNWATDSTVGAQWKKMRPYFTWANLPSLGDPGNNNSCSFKINRIKVDKVTLQ